MSTVNTPAEEPHDAAEGTAGPSRETGAGPAASEVAVPVRLGFTSVPALLTSLLLSVILFIAVLYGWYAIGPGIRGQITVPQTLSLLAVALILVGVMMSVGYSRLWADERGVTIRNGPILRKIPIDQVAGLRLRDGDPWAYLLVKNGHGGVDRRAVLAIQQLEGARAKRKVSQVRRWLKANGASSAGITLTED